jgi:RNA ligase partner protein
MPPRIVEEIYYLVDANTKPKIDEFLAQVTVQSPTIHNQTIGVHILYDFVNESRVRTQQGLHIADEIIVQTAQSYLQKQEMAKIDFQKSLQPIKENLRLRYRNATRTGFIDSLADLDLLFLAKESEASLISADEGVVLWGRKMGVKEMGLSVFGETMRQLL